VYGIKEYSFRILSPVFVWLNAGQNKNEETYVTQ